MGTRLWKAEWGWEQHCLSPAKQKEIISLTGHEIIHSVFFKVNHSSQYSLPWLMKSHQGCPHKKPKNICLQWRTLMCSCMRTVSRLSTPGHQKGPKTVPWQNSPAYSFTTSFSCLSPSVAGCLEDCQVFLSNSWVFCKGQWPQDGFAARLLQEMLPAQPRSYRSRWRIQKMLNLVPEIANA